MKAWCEREDSDECGEMVITDGRQQPACAWAVPEERAEQRGRCGHLTCIADSTL